MATYTETFTGQTTGANSTTFTNRYAAESNISVENPAVGEEDDRVLRFNTGDSGIQLQSFDSVDGDGNRDNCEIVCRYYPTNDDDNQQLMIARASGSGSSETMYFCGINTGGTFYVGRYNSGSLTTIATGSDVDKTGAWFDWASDTYNFTLSNQFLWMRFRVNGTGATVTLQAKFWADGQNEPSAWDIDTTDTTGSRITAAGWIGFGRSIHTGASYLDYFSVGTNGDSPTIAAGDSPVRVTQVTAHALYQDNTTPVRVTQVTAHVLYTEAANPKTVTQQVAEVAVQQDAASIETRVTQQVLEVLMSLTIPHFVTQQVAEVAVQQNASAVTVRSTHAVIEVLQTVPPGPAYDNVIQPIAVMI